MREILKNLIRRFRKKPAIIEAFEWTGEIDSEISEFLKGTPRFISSGKHLVIHTPNGDMTADIGDFIIRGVKGEVYPCKPDIFWETYEEILDDNE